MQGLLKGVSRLFKIGKLAQPCSIVWFRASACATPAHWVSRVSHLLVDLAPGEIRPVRSIASLRRWESRTLLRYQCSCPGYSHHLCKPGRGLVSLPQTRIVEASWKAAMQASCLPARFEGRSGQQKNAYATASKQSANMHGAETSEFRHELWRPSGRFFA
jgi:hypothetical protein